MFAPLLADAATDQAISSIAGAVVIVLLAISQWIMSRTIIKNKERGKRNQERLDSIDERHQAMDDDE